MSSIERDSEPLATSASTAADVQDGGTQTTARASARRSLSSVQQELASARAECQQLARSLREAEDRHRETSERLQCDLALAREIQHGLLPCASPEWDELDLFCFTRPAAEIGGDFYTHRASNKPGVLLNKYMLAVGDVSGKGVSAALLMATTLSRFDAIVDRPFGPAERLAHLDREIMPFTKPRRQNCALCYVEIVGVNTVRPLLRTANAGCIPPFVKGGDGAVEWIVIEGPPLGHGLGAKHGYKEVVKKVSKGDLVVLTSDGVVEAQDENGELYGFDRLQEAISAGPPGCAESLLEYLRDDVSLFVGGADQQDDMTILVAKI